MDRHIDYTLLYRVAKAYFLDGRTQQEIADIENFSRSQISRILKKALDENLVSYRLNFPSDVNEAELSQALREHLGLERVVNFFVMVFYLVYFNLLFREDNIYRWKNRESDIKKCFQVLQRCLSLNYTCWLTQ